MSDCIRVAGLIGNLNKEHGGAQQLLYDIFRRLPEEFQPRVYHLFGPGTFREDFETAGIPVHHLEAGSNYDLRAFWRLRHRLREDRPDILHTNSPISGVWGRIAAMLVSDLQVVSVEHSVRRAYRIWPRLANGLTLPLADAVVGVSQPAVDSLRSAWEGRLLPAGTEVVSIPNGVDTERFSPGSSNDGAGDDDLIVGTVGRLIDAKGFDRLLRAWPRVIDSVPEARLQIVGDGPKRGELESLAKKLRVDASVAFLGYRANPLPAYRRFDVAVFPSRWEGFGLTVAEAMATSVPVIAADIQSFRHVVGEAGLLVAGANTDALAGTIVDLLEHPERRVRLGAAGRQRVRAHFSADCVACDYAELYWRVVPN